jgi:hypothetical protein
LSTLNWSVTTERTIVIRVSFATLFSFPTQSRGINHMMLRRTLKVTDIHG